jgi:hypothetical protein
LNVDIGDSSIECLIEETAALNVSPAQLIKMGGRGSRFQFDIERRCLPFSSLTRNDNERRVSLCRDLRKSK